MLVPYQGLNEANPSRPVNDSSGGFKVIARLTGG
jgi:hypothetical protein